MFKALRIAFACAAAALAVACVFLGIFLGIVPFFCGVAGAVFFFAMSLLFKFLQEDREKNSETDSSSRGGAAGHEADAPSADGQADGTFVIKNSDEADAPDAEEKQPREISAADEQPREISAADEQPRETSETEPSAAKNERSDNTSAADEPKDGISAQVSAKDGEAAPPRK